MTITPVLPNGYNGPLKQLTYQVCQQVFYLPLTDYQRLETVLACHACSLRAQEAAGVITTDLTNSLSLWTVKQGATTLHLGRTKVYELIWREGLPVIRFGRAVRVSPEALRKWLEQREQQP